MKQPLIKVSLCSQSRFTSFMYSKYISRNCWTIDRIWIYNAKFNIEITVSSWHYKMINNTIQIQVNDIVQNAHSYTVLASHAYGEIRKWPMLVWSLMFKPYMGISVHVEIRILVNTQHIHTNTVYCLHSRHKSNRFQVIGQNTNMWIIAPPPLNYRSAYVFVTLFW